MNERTAAVMAALLLAGCSGGGGSAVPRVPVSGSTQSVTVRLAIPAKSSASAERAHPQFVVSATNGLEIVATNAGDTQVADQTYDVSSSSPLCTTSAGLRSCMLAFALAPCGPYVVTLTSYDLAPSGGTIPPGAHVLARGAIPNVTVAQGSSNALSATLDGTPATLTFATARSVALQNGSTATIALPLGVTDASGTAIVGAFSAQLWLGTMAPSAVGGSTDTSYEIASGYYANQVWAGGFTGELYRYDAVTHAVTAQTSPGGLIAALTLGADGKMWATDESGSRIISIVP